MKTPSHILDTAKKAFEAKRWFEAELMTLKLIEDARGTFDFDTMAAGVPVLRDARMARFEEAFRIADDSIRLLTESLDEDAVATPGCWLIQPPLVGADGRNLRALAIEQEVPVAVLCREPLTQLGLQPIVSIGRITIRTKIDPPAQPQSPDMDWYRYALDELGESAIDSVDTGIDIVKQVDALLDRINTVQEHARLHDALEETCRLAAESMRNRG
jgi:hypothetical protein